MKNRILRWFKYKTTRFYLGYLRMTGITKMLESSELNDEQRIGVKIVKMLAVQKDSEILMAPISNRYFIKNEEILIVTGKQIGRAHV